MRKLSATILAVDDEPAVLELLIEVLSDAGYEVRTARDGREALAAVADDRPDLVLSDVFMPRLDGWSLAGELRRRYRSVAVVMMSAFRPEFPIEGLRFVPKPFDFGELLTAIEDALGEGNKR